MKTIMKMKILMSCITILSIVNASAQTYIKYTNNNKQQLLGEVNVDILKEEGDGFWQDSIYQGYTDDRVEMLKRFSPQFKDITVNVYFGTWCGDSKREIPKFVKLMDLVEFPKENLHFFALDNREGKYKQGLHNYTEDDRIFRVPTFVFKHGNSELDRIIEYPSGSFGLDIIKVLSKRYNYVPNYLLADVVSKLIDENKIPSVVKYYKSNAFLLHEIAANSGQLNSLGYLYLEKGMTNKSKIAFELNTFLFPKTANVWDSYAEYFYTQKNFKKAKKYYEKVLEIDSSEENAKEMLEKIKGKTS